MLAPPKGFVCPCEAQHLQEVLLSPATLLPYPRHQELRPVALRPTLSDGLPFSNEKKI